VPQIAAHEAEPDVRRGNVRPLALSETLSGIWCIYIRPEMTKGDYQRVVPIHSHLIDQGFLDFVEERRTLKLPLFYDPKRARGGKNANPTAG
jgi:hypothetical protein